MESSNTSALDVSKKWFLVPLPLRTCSLKDIATTTVEKEDMDRYFNEAQAVLEKECGNGQQDRGRWYNAQFLARGTTADKVAAAAVKLTDNDFMFFLDGFNQLFDTARTDTHHYEAALKALAAVWPKLLPPRPLKRFVVQYFATLPTEDGPRRRVLVYWYLEDFLKRTYAQFLSLCEAMLKDRLMQRREAWLEVVGKLLCSVAESRHTVMAMMIDKLGDPNAQLAHKAYHYLLKLLSESSTHQTMLFTELEKIVFMPNCPLRTMRYAANVMNQLVFSKDERRLALKSVQTYLLLFRQLVMTGHVDSTVTTAIIVGLRRAFPYAGTDIAPLEKHLNALFVLANTGNFQQRVATLSLLQLLALGKGTQEAFRHRWYRALYQLLLLSPKQLPQSAQLTNFFSMLHKAMRADTNDERVAAFVHRLLQRAVYFTDAMVCAVLLLVGEMAQTRPSVRRLLQQAPSHDSAAEEKRYDPKHREPQYARARQECLWTLNLLAHHSHPSVVKLAVLLLFGEETVFDVHPLDDMTPLNFLEMFVESKSQAKEDSTGGSSGGSSVFRRAVHAPTIPRASDPYFIGAKARDVDVSALFLHRYAVQRQRFVEGLSQVQPTWGATSGEDDVVMRVSNLDAALFGPTGVLADDSTEGRAEKEEAEEEVKKTKKTSTKKAPKAPIEQDEDVPSEEDEDLHPEQWSGGSEGSSASADFDAEGSEDDLEWGSDDEAAYDGAVEDDDGYSDDDGDDNALGGSRASKRDEVDGDEFGEIMAASNKAPSKKRMREDAWLESRSSDAPARGRFGEQQRSYSGRGSSSSRGRGGRGGRYTGGPSRGGRGAGRR